jgi:hypothetical protein
MMLFRSWICSLTLAILVTALLSGCGSSTSTASRERAAKMALSTWITDIYTDNSGACRLQPGTQLVQKARNLWSEEHARQIVSYGYQKGLQLAKVAVPDCPAAVSLIYRDFVRTQEPLTGKVLAQTLSEIKQAKLTGLEPIFNGVRLKFSVHETETAVDIVDGQASIQKSFSPTYLCLDPYYGNTNCSP